MASLVWVMRTGPLAVLEFDAVMAETHLAQADVTEHPVEVGANISDHVRPKLRVVTTEILITNTPVNETTVGDMFPIGAIVLNKTPALITHLQRFRTAPPSLTNGWVAPYRIPGTLRPAGLPQALAAQSTEGQVNISGSVFQALSQTDRVKECYNALVALCLTGRIVQYITDLQEYDYMVINSVSVARRCEDAIRCQLELKEFRWANSETVEIVKKRPKEKRGEVAVSEGSKSTYAGPEERPRTVFLRGVQAAAQAGIDYGAW